MILATKSLILFSSFAYLASQPARVRIASSSPFVEFYESHTHTVDMFIRASEQQHQAYGYTAESECVTITANVRILHTCVLNILYGPYNKLLYFHCGKSKMATIPVLFLWVRQNGQVPGQVDM